MAPEAQGMAPGARKAEVHYSTDQEVIHLEWIANPIMVQKHIREGRMCVDFTEFNKACTKDQLPLALIDQVVDSTIGCDMLCFMDAFAC